jgi:cob(I)alamin adenosyltransferase
MTELTTEQHRVKMQRRQEVQHQRIADRQIEKGLIIVTTGVKVKLPPPWAWCYDR